MINSWKDVFANCKIITHSKYIHIFNVTVRAIKHTIKSY